MAVYLLPAIFVAMFVGAALGPAAAVVALAAVAVSGFLIEQGRSRS